MLQVARRRFHTASTRMRSFFKQCNLFHIRYEAIAATRACPRPIVVVCERVLPSRLLSGHDPFSLPAVVCRRNGENAAAE